jgi:cell division protein FtsL
MITGNFTRRKYLRIFDPEYNYSSNRASGKIVLIIVIVFLYMSVCTWLLSQSINYNYKSNELSKERDKLKIANRALEIKLQSMMSSDQIAKIAKERYGFKYPSENQIIIIKKDRSISEIIKGIFKGEVL